MTKDELIPILEKHAKWLNNEDGGERADLYGADLRGADLRGASLYGANLYGADLYGADLYGADLYGASLRGANLYGADLYGANLYGADLYGANLYGADHIITAGPIGSRRDITFYHISGDLVRCGCFSGALEEFEAKVESTHADNSIYLAEYRAAITFFKSVKESRGGN